MATLPPSPQLLSRAAGPPNGDGYLHEIKWDGYRLLASVERGTVGLFSRPGANWTARLPTIARAVSSLGLTSLALDGELVYLTDDGFPDFEALQSTARKQGDARLYYQVFDLLNIDGEDLTSRPFIERKERLRELLGRAAHPRLRYVEHVAGDGPAFFRAVDALGLEGIVSKRARSVYRPGIRSTDWIKVKCFRTQHFAVVGYTTENGVLATLALAGEHEGRLHYAGRVEWGVPRRDDTLLRALETLGTNSSEWPHRGVAWVEPKLSAEVRSLAWSPGRHLRHAVLRTIAVS